MLTSKHPGRHIDICVMSGANNVHVHDDVPVKVINLMTLINRKPAIFQLKIKLQQFMTYLIFESNIHLAFVHLYSWFQ